MHFPFKYVYRETRKSRLLNNIRIFAYQNTDQRLIDFRRARRQRLKRPLEADLTVPDFIFSRVYPILFQDQRERHDASGPLQR